ncbi:glycosyltransferase family 39 protein, partial [Paracoccaceae bacterium]|nr:glycosyltransferase family 39 protein [Paracoccaceae bacterium]
MKSKAYNQTHLLIFLFIIFCLTKLTVIKHLPLINDEAYTLTISRYFSLSYFDHPPLMMWISYCLHLLEVFQLHIFRAPFIGFGLLTSFFLYKITSKFYSKQAGTVSAILYFISPFFFFSGGLFVVPDASLNFSVAGATYIAIRLIFYKEDNIYLWLSLGLLLS